MRVFEVQIGDDVARWEVSGETGFGGDEVLLAKDDDLTAGTSWAADGYTVAPFLPREQRDVLVQHVTDLISRIATDEGLSVPPGFQLADYHEMTGGDAGHAKVVARTRKCFPIAQLPFAVSVLEERVSAILGVDVKTHDHPEVPDLYCIRIVRPQAPDNNPPHRDVWLDRLRNAVNIYMPLAASNARSSLSLVPGSHRWKESEIERTMAGAIVGKHAFTVPSVVGATRPMRMVRPNPTADEVMVFSPYLIHGGARNFNADETRVSLEMRFIRR